MKTINVSDETKERFMELKFEKMGEERRPCTDDEFENILLDKFEEKKK